MRRTSAALLAALLALIIGLGSSPGISVAANPNVGYRGVQFGTPTSSLVGDDPTASKPQSKLWWNDGSWWAVLFTMADSRYHIYRLNGSDPWVDTQVVVDDRPLSRADALWDGSHLYIASTLSNINTTAANEGRLYRYSYAGGTYTLDAGFPAVMMTGSTETLAIDKDTTGKLWITFTQNKKVYFNHSGATDQSWGAPMLMPNAAAVASDDIASLVAYRDQNGSAIGVLWSNHNNPSSMYFAYHKDGDPDTTWSPIESIYAPESLACAADDHINLKSLQSDPSGAIYAAVKTSFGDSGCGGTSASPLIRLVVRKPNNTWKVATFGTVADDHTRPLVLLDTTNRKVYMFATSSTSCGIIYMKSTGMDNPDFSSQAGKGTPFISSSTYTCINNATSTKQTVNATTGLVVLASDMKGHYYLHNKLALGTPPSDTTPPTVSSTTPANTATNISISTSVTAAFSEALSASTVTSTTFTLTGPGGSVAANVAYNSATNTATLQPSAALAAGTAYTARVSGVKDVAGNMLAGTYSWTFSTAAPPSDTTPPTVSSTTPANNAANVSTGTSVSASFSEPVDSSTVNGTNVKLTSPSGAVAASVTYNSSTNTATLQPSAALASSTTYTAQVSGVKDLAGNTLATAYSWVFTTAAAAPPGSSFTFGPAVDTYVSQASPTSNYATNNQLQVVGGTSTAKQALIRFDVSGLPAGATVSSAKLRLFVTNDSTSGGVINAISNTSWAENITWNGKPAIDGPQLATLGAAALNSTMEVDLTSAIGGNGSYSFVLSLPSANTNTLGYASREYSIAANRPQLIVTTSGSAPVDTTPPTVVGISPANSAQNVSSATGVTATFSEAVDPSTVTGSNFALAGPGGLVAASVTYNSGTKTATLQPSAALADGAGYSVQVVSVKDIAGNSMASAYSWSFSTAAAPPADTTPPTLIATSPASGATEVGVAASITASFSEALNAGTIDGTTFRLIGPGGPVAATVSYDSASKVATLAPSTSLGAGISYTAMLTGTITDLAGNALATPNMWSFTTAVSAPPASSFTFGPVADTYVSQASPTSSYATGSSVSAVDGSGSAKQIYLRFTVSGLPAGAPVSSAKLRLYVTNDSTSGGIVQSVSNTTWLEALTWNSKPAIDGPVRATFGAVAINTTVEVDLGVAITGNGSYSFAIMLPAGNSNTVGYSSRENGTVSNRPQLVITTN